MDHLLFDINFMVNLKVVRNFMIFIEDLELTQLHIIVAWLDLNLDILVNH